jgi:hypothetical protein
VGLWIVAALKLELGSEPLLLPLNSPFVTLSPPCLLHDLFQFFIVAAQIKNYDGISYSKYS